MKVYVKSVNCCWECPSYYELPFLSKECQHKHRRYGSRELSDDEKFCECCPLMDINEYADFGD